MERRARSPAEPLFQLLLAACLGAYLLLLTVAAYLPGGLGKQETYFVFFQGWLTIPLLIGLALWSIDAVRGRLFPGMRAFYPALAAATGAFTVGWVTTLHLVSVRFPAATPTAIGAIERSRRRASFCSRSTRGVPLSPGALVGYGRGPDARFLTTTGWTPKVALEKRCGPRLD